MRALAVILVPWIVLVAATPARACRCAERTLVELYEQADLVFLGAVLSIAPADGEVEARFEVDGATFKGTPDAAIAFRTPSSSVACGVPLLLGTRYLVFAERDAPDAPLARVSSCGGTRAFDPLQAGDARDFPDVISERALDALTKLRVAAEMAVRPIGGVPLEGSLLGLVTLPMTFDRDLDEVVLETPYATLELRERPDADAPVVRTVTGEADVRTREHAYEIEGAEVFGERAGWLELRTADGRAGWLRPPPGATYHPLEELVVKRLGYLTEAWDGRLWPSPGAGLPYEPRPTAGGRESAVEVVEAQRVGDSLWFHVKLWRENPCTGSERNSAQVGWVPAWSAEGAVTTWFWSRGC